MGRKKRKGAQLKPFCYYCEREFDDEKVLVQHQKAKHFKCSECNRKLDTATGLIVHMLQVHKETISRVPNAIAGRDDPDLIIHGTTGVPEELINEKRAKLEEQRDASKDQKTAHTVMGMNVMNGFFNQVAAGGNNNMNMLLSCMFPALANLGTYGGHNIISNPFVLSQLMAQLNQNPQTFAAAIANGLLPQNPGMSNLLNPAVNKNMNPQPRPISLMVSNPNNATEKPSDNFGKFLGAINKGITPLQGENFLNQNNPNSGMTTIPVSGLGGGTLNRELGKVRLVSDPLVDTISPEEMLAEHYGWHSGASQQAGLTMQPVTRPNSITSNGSSIPISAS